VSRDRYAKARQKRAQTKHSAQAAKIPGVLRGTECRDTQDSAGNKSDSTNNAQNQDVPADLKSCSTVPTEVCEYGICDGENERCYEHDRANQDQCV
jgi:hypothetical protein